MPNNEEAEPLDENRFAVYLLMRSQLLNHPNANDLCDLCGHVISSHEWAIVDYYGFVVIGCSFYVQTQSNTDSQSNTNDTPHHEGNTAPPTPQHKGKEFLVGDD